MTVRICIGTEPKTEIARKVLEHSILRHTDAEVEFHPMSSADRPDSLRGRTGFSLERWSLPERFGYEGKALYLDADQLVFGDVLELWNSDERHPKEGCAVWCVPENSHWLTSVMLVDNERARDWPTMDELAHHLVTAPGRRRFHYRRLMTGRRLDPSPGFLEETWNHLDTFVPGETRLLHFTNRRTQPWFYARHPLAHLWGEALVAALADGAVDEDEVLAACADFRVGRNGFAESGLDPHWAGLVRERQAV